MPLASRIYAARERHLCGTPPFRLSRLLLNISIKQSFFFQLLIFLCRSPGEGTLGRKQRQRGQHRFSPENRAARASHTDDLLYHIIIKSYWTSQKMRPSVVSALLPYFASVFSSSTAALKLSRFSVLGVGKVLRRGIIRSAPADFISSR